jgi:hypothetical protein
MQRKDRSFVAEMSWKLTWQKSFTYGFCGLCLLSDGFSLKM